VLQGEQTKEIVTNVKAAKTRETNATRSKIIFSTEKKGYFGNRGYVSF